MLTPAKYTRSWALVERGLNDSERALLHAVKDDPDQNLALYQLASVHRLVAVGLGFDQIAEELASRRVTRGAWNSRIDG